MTYQLIGFNRFARENMKRHNDEINLQLVEESSIVYFRRATAAVSWASRNLPAFSTDH